MFLQRLFVNILLLCSIAQATLDDDGHLNPWVDSFGGVVSPEYCNAIIAEADRVGFPMEADSIDHYEAANNYSQAIILFERETVLVDQSLWSLVEPLLPRLTEIVQATKEKVWDLTRAREKVPECGWIFLRKYAPTTERFMLRLHQDSNMFTVNLFLSDDYQGGGLFYVRPPEDLGFVLSTAIPNVPAEWSTYEWLENVKRENSTITRFPELKQGDVLIHNYTVWHAIAPLESGVKYSLLFFFDMDNPDAQEIRNREVVATFINFETEGTIQLMSVHRRTGEWEETVMIPAMQMGEEYYLNSFERDVWWAVRKEDGEVIANFEIEYRRVEPHVYIIGENPDQLVVKIINLVTEGTIDLMWMNPNSDPPHEVLTHENIVVGEEFIAQSYDGHNWRAIRREDHAIMLEFQVEAGRTEPYMIVDVGVPGAGNLETPDENKKTVTQDEL